MTKLTNLIEIEPAANHIGNKTLSAIQAIHGVEHTCGEGKTYCTRKNISSEWEGIYGFLARTATRVLMLRLLRARQQSSWPAPREGKPAGL